MLRLGVTGPDPNLPAPPNPFRSEVLMTSIENSESPQAPSDEVLTPEELRKTDAYWRACNYLCAGMIYLRDNPLLKAPLRPEHFKNP